MNSFRSSCLGAIFGMMLVGLFHLGVDLYREKHSNSNTVKIQSIPTVYQLESNNKSSPTTYQTQSIGKRKVEIIRGE